MAPYASIIIPTHNRASTLPASIRSALAQTVGDIEVLLVGDGVTPEVRRVAQAFARQDGRLRFLDLPKAPLRGVANRDLAVREAAAERIFYNDDDDLLLPSHVEVLGAALDDADIADTPPVSVQPDGSVCLGVHDSAHPAIRRLLIEERFKSVFDTHLAHRKSAYTENAGAWMAATDRRVVLHMLKFFAGDAALRWTSVHRITALSFHGGCRTGMTGEARAREIAHWETRIAAGDLETQIRRAGSYAFYLWVTLSQLRNLGDPSRDAAARHLVGWLENEVALDARQTAALGAVRMIVEGTYPGEADALVAFDDLLEARIGPFFPTGEIVARFAAACPADFMQRLLAGCRPRPALALARLHLAAREGAIDAEAVTAVEAAMAETPEGMRFFFGLAALQCFVAHGDLDAAWGWSERLREIAPHSYRAQRLWRLRLRIARAQGRAAEAREAVREIERLEDCVD
ncbi:glycosyltransferase family 2 protein [Parvibaculum sp.]|uniref:glycosyltransferase family 2 protein n=1 Tax=Parvibaculum sp. TaxID=2024848 RepID=UPI00349FEF01